MRMVDHYDEETGRRFTYDADRVQLCNEAANFITKVIARNIQSGDDPQWWCNEAERTHSLRPEVLAAVRSKLAEALAEIQARPAWRPWRPEMIHHVVRMAGDYFTWESIDELRLNEPRSDAP